MATLAESDLGLSEQDRRCLTDTIRCPQDPVFKRWNSCTLKQCVHRVQDQTVDVSGRPNLLGEIERGVELASTAVVDPRITQ